MTVQEMLRASALERGYTFPTIAFAPLPDPKVSIVKVGPRRYNLEVSDYMERLPDDLAHGFAESLVAYITGERQTGIPEEVRDWIRENYLGGYIRRKGFLRPEDVRAADLQALADQMKRAGTLPKDVTVVWTAGETFASPTFRLVAVSTSMLETEDLFEIAAEIAAGAHILRMKGARE